MADVLKIIDDKLTIDQAARIIAPHYEVVYYTSQWDPVPHYCPYDGCMSCWVDFEHNRDSFICTKCLERKGV